MLHTLEDKDWDILLRRIQRGKCTPFLGAGACAGTLPLGSEIAQEWAKSHNYPLEDSSDLARVAQFLAVQYDPMFPKGEIQDKFENITPPDFTEPDEPHGVLADLPLPVYLTTNYDDFMVQALKSRNKDPKQELCRWNNYLQRHPEIHPSIFESDPDFSPTPANPLVFHLHGHIKILDSLVLTEDDYLDFLVRISRDPTLLPPRIEEALTGASLLFIGYRLADWDFRVLWRGLVASLESTLRRISLTVQFLPETLESKQKEAQKYLNKYFGKMDVRVYWEEDRKGRKFLAELRGRWEKFCHGN